MEQRLEVCSLVLKENPKVNKVKLFQYAGVKRSTFYSQKEEGLPIAPMGSKGRRPIDYSYDVHGNMVLDASIRKALHDYSCLLYTSPSPRDGLLSRMPSSA